eukprot:TRINITY_DN8761_c0_g1_i1.p1 TRINITY_DN8761_c0_g1~~TRINITY_DN8761_c0_g1_i1.p1  ORF type:complete len:194 (+),score=32.42 TRINITY_DN8761_c0_g1_i1:82-582(+)
MEAHERDRLEQALFVLENSTDPVDVQVAIDVLRVVFIQRKFADEESHGNAIRFPETSYNTPLLHKRLFDALKDVMESNQVDPFGFDTLPGDVQVRLIHGTDEWSEGDAGARLICVEDPETQVIVITRDMDSHMLSVVCDLHHPIIVAQPSGASVSDWKAYGVRVMV